MFSSPDTILLLKASSLEIYTKNQDQATEIGFPPTIVKHLEIVNPALFEKLILEAATQLPKKNAYLCLSDEVLFSKALPRSDDEEAQIDSFYNQVPLDSEKIAKKFIYDTEQVLLFATNREIYSKIIEIFAGFKWKIPAVVPLPLFLENTPHLTPDQVKEVLKNKATLKSSDFLLDNLETKTDKAPAKAGAEEKPEDDETKEAKTSNKSQIIILSFTTTFMLLALGFAGLKLGFIKNPFAKAPTASPSPASTEATTSASLDSNPQEASASPEIAPKPTETSQTASESAEVIKLDKSQLKFQILNGSGVPGQANRLKDQLSELGYKNFTTDTAPDPATKTIVGFSKQVALEDRDQITDSLVRTFSNVGVIEETPPGFDVSITTGK